jgi:triosephosphate isomerase (TIM)
MAQKIVAGNWKMNLESEEAFQLVESLNEKVNNDNVRVILFPPSLYILPIVKMNKGKYDVGAQNFFIKDSGAFTGEISIPQIKSVGGTSVLIGHSERRAFFGEHNAFLKNKVDLCVYHGIDYIFCCGEPLEIREAGTELDFVRQQLDESLFHLTAEQIDGGIIAYEPVWAIGTGKTASSEQAESMHMNIRSWISEKYGDAVANNVSILYGGSCNPGNAKELFACPNVDGGLIGGAALKAEDFNAIIESY